MPYAEALTNRKYQPPELINISERNEPRALLSADVYGFACIAWVSSLIRLLALELSPRTSPTSGPFDTAPSESRGDGVASQQIKKLKNVFD